MTFETIPDRTKTSFIFAYLGLSPPGQNIRTSKPNNP